MFQLTEKIGYDKKDRMLFARITPLAFPDYRVDFSSHDNDYDSDDEDHEWQWTYPIYFAYVEGLFLNRREVEYDTRERYSCRVFPSQSSTNITEMIRNTLAVRRARGERMPPFSIDRMCAVADDRWFRYQNHLP